MALDVLAPQGNLSTRLWHGISSLPMMRYAKAFVSSAVTAVVVRPLAHLYLFGPTYLGFWGGRRPEDICSQLTGVDAGHWNHNDGNLEACLQHIEKHFNSWLVLGYTILYFAIPVSLCWWLCRCRRPKPVTIQLMTQAATETHATF
jgi:hypothetical protein